MGQGKYERTPLTKARFQMTMTDQRIAKLHAKLAEAEQAKQALQIEINELELKEAN
jgi:hypothetical protein